MSLKEKLAALKTAAVQKMPPEALQVIQRARQRLEESGLAGKARKAGDRAPAFSLPDTSGNVHDLQAMLTRGPVVLVFFRGGW
ncbi:hypothetical protein EDC39_10435 [Geothermobacter ehrlichii]|uniref:AhpC/TSA family protein n=1 Tax=Geothermobacter ehrlichii TaxID=213224 RepID=A0A5D3WJY1_9BACT|nr:hypothetical protein [Geothermobacter ehrlichii]TYO98911.1 hypothetical protein EDC39_10435 [Geothermobacter ehrlichii]